MEQKPRLPRPYVDYDAEPYWEGIQRGELLMQRCQKCARFRWFPRPQCPHCNSFEREWVRVSGKGKLYSWAVVVHPVHPATETKVPYNVAQVALDEDPATLRLVTAIVDCKLEDLEFDMPVEVTIRTMEGWEEEGVKLPYFRPAK